jgi:hypothetical protein
MLGSKSTYFSQSFEKLTVDRAKVNLLLLYKGYNQEQVDIYLKAFDYFSKNTLEFDGATVVKDLVDIPGLDLDAMLHDYHYIFYRISSSFSLKFKADWIYSKGQERKGKGQYSSFSRFIGLTIIGLFLVPLRYIMIGKPSAENKKGITNDYIKLIYK